MPTTDKNSEGIVPSILRMRELFDELTRMVRGCRDEAISLEAFALIEEKIAQYSVEVRTLPETINKSYELIQMVIASIHTSRSELKKSVDGLLKKTGMQLQKVTSTTEEATNKILDVAEKLDEDQMKIIAILEDIEARISASSDEDLTAKFEEVKSKVYQNQESAFLIIDFLQFQDITAQQIAGAYSLLSDTEKTLLFVSDMLKRFDTDREKLAGAIKEIDKRSFNEEASFTDKKVLQEAIDDLFETGDANAPIPDAGKGEAESGESASEGTSQQDIDALFGDSGKKKSSQDEIDKLFS